ncbi:MAG: EamA family transporter [Tagaea sp.]
MWVVFGLCAGFILGIYDIATKKGMSGNDVLPVVFWSSVFGALCWLPPILALSFDAVSPVRGAGLTAHLLLLPKSAMMTASWILAYYAVKRLSLSLAGAVRASGPIWTMAGGVVLFAEVLTPLQSAGLTVTVAAYYAFAVVGRKEAVFAGDFAALLLMLCATLCSALVTVYDKYLVVALELGALDIQAWSAVQRTTIAGLACLIAARRGFDGFRLRRPDRSIVVIGVTWVAAEYVYFLAYRDPEAMVTLLSVLRRMSLVVSFAYSAAYMGEANLRLKTAMIAGLLAGTGMMVLGK